MTIWSYGNDQMKSERVVTEKSFTSLQENDPLENPPSIFLINFNSNALLFAV